MRRSAARERPIVKTGVRISTRLWLKTGNLSRYRYVPFCDETIVFIMLKRTVPVACLYKRKKFFNAKPGKNRKKNERMENS
jgi:hypothetical protein